MNNSTQDLHISSYFFDQRLRASERLKRRKQIEYVFTSGKTAKAYPLRLVYTILPNSAKKEEHFRDAGLQLGVVASKRIFKKAPDRNLVKRRMRESIRLHKAPLSQWLQDQDARLEGMLIYTGKSLPDQQQITKAWLKLLRRLDGNIFPS